MWLVLGVIKYLKESGDLVFLDEAVRYYDSGTETVRQHVLRAIEYTLAHMSDRGIPLIMAADWNDGLDYVGRQGRGETTMVAAHLAWMLREVAAVLWFVGSDTLAEKYIEDDNSVTLPLNELDLVENGITENDAKMKLAEDILEYAEDYYSDFDYWKKAPNRKNHIPYVLKALILQDVNKIGESILCQIGKN
jgi:hypothetical protein